MARDLRYLASVTTLRLDEERCTGCRRCTEVCPHGVFGVAGRKAALVEPDRCMECGACAMNCAAGAISVTAGVGCALLVMGSGSGLSGLPPES